MMIPVIPCIPNPISFLVLKIWVPFSFCFLVLFFLVFALTPQNSETPESRGVLCLVLKSYPRTLEPWNPEVLPCPFSLKPQNLGILEFEFFMFCHLFVNLETPKSRSCLVFPSQNPGVPSCFICFSVFIPEPRSPEVCSCFFFSNLRISEPRNFEVCFWFSCLNYLGSLEPRTPEVMFKAIVWMKDWGV